jgi:hypothetical protein
MSTLTFDEASHTYHFGGQVVPGVTSILSPLTDFSRVPPAVLEAASQFGKAVHRACELDDLGTLDEDSLDPALKPYLQAWRKFSAEHQVQWDVIEEPVYHATMRYAGTPDRFGLVNGVRTVVDIKSTAQLYPAVGPQLSAYANALLEPFAIRMAVQLKADGTYVAKTYKDPTDWPMFASLLTLRTWCKQHSITPNFKD